LGAVQNEIFRRTHQTMIPQLQPGTTYHFSLVSLNRRGTETVLREGTFTTETPPDTDAPPNVADFSAAANGTAVDLSWRLPDVPDLAYVRVVRNHFYYPLSPTDGFVAFEGLSTGWRDEAALLDYSGQYYTVFSYDETGNRSSGVVTYVQAPSDTRGEGAASGVDQAAAIPNAVPPDRIETDAEGVPTPPPPEPSGAVQPIEFTDLWFWQDEVYVAPVNGLVALSADAPFRVEVPVELVPDRFRSLVLTVQAGAVDQSYLFDLGRSETMYVTTVPSIPPAQYDATLVVRTLAGEEYTIATGTIQLTTQDGFVRNEAVPYVYLWLQQYWIWLFLLLLLLIGWWAWRRSTRYA